MGELHYDPTGLRQPKMVASAGSSRELFPPPEMIGDDELDEHRTVWLVEGEPDAIRLWSLGVPAVAVPGAQNWRDDDAPRFTGRRWRVIVCFDCDAPGRENAERAAAAIVDAGGDARLLDLDPGEQHGYDLTDWLQKADTAELRDQAAAALATIAETLELYRPPRRDEPPATDELESARGCHRRPSSPPSTSPAPTRSLGSDDAPLIPEGGDVDGLRRRRRRQDDALRSTSPATSPPATTGSASRPAAAARAAHRERRAAAAVPPQAAAQARRLGRLAARRPRCACSSEPWGAFTFADDELARARSPTHDRASSEIDVVIVGPLTPLGHGRRPARCRRSATSSRSSTTSAAAPAGRVAFVLVHHENKGGKVSGAWEGAGDTLLHVTAQGHGRTRALRPEGPLGERLARDDAAPRLGRRRRLRGRGEARARRRRRSPSGSSPASRANPGTGWTKVEKQITGVANGELRRVRDSCSAPA